MPDAVAVFGVLIPVVRGAVILALLLAGWVAVRYARGSGLPPDRVDRAAVAVGIAGVIGARLGFVALNWSAFQGNPLSVLFVWQPGFNPWAGLLIGGAYGLWRFGGQRALVRPLLVGFGVAALLPVLAYAATQTRFAALGANSVRIGDSAPALRLVNLEGKPVSLRQLRGQVVVLNFWATWCPPCRREMPMLEAVQQEYAARGVVIVGVDVAEGPERVAASVADIGVRYSIWLEGAGSDSTQAAFARFGGVGLPTTVFVDRAGTVRARQIGELNRASVTSNLAAMLP
jgi:thiol-disulfide isomerase/thioredoxin